MGLAGSAASFTASTYLMYTRPTRVVVECTNELERIKENKMNNDLVVAIRNAQRRVCLAKDELTILRMMAEGTTNELEAPAVQEMIIHCQVVMDGATQAWWTLFELINKERETK